MKRVKSARELNLIPYTGRERWMDPATTFTRQEIAEKTGLTDDILSFWGKRGLLVPVEGGEGKGSHRRYDAAQINVAAILSVYRDHFGANITLMKSLSDLLQRSIKTFRKVDLPLSAWGTVAYMADELHRFRTSEPVMIRAHNYHDPDYDDLNLDERLRKQPAVNEAEILARFDDNDAPMRILIRTAEKMGPGRTVDSIVAKVIEGMLIDPEYSSDELWLLRQHGGKWDIRTANDGSNFNLDDVETFGPAAFIPVGPIIRRIWNIPHYRMLRNLRLAKELQRVLDKHRIAATVSPSEDERCYVIVDAPEADFDIIAPLAAETVTYYMLRDPAQPESGEAAA